MLQEASAPVGYYTLASPTIDGEPMKPCAAALLAMSLFGCAARTPDATLSVVSDEGCPVVVLERFGGLGSEGNSGLIAAVWRSGKIVRSASIERPWGDHILGRLAPGPLADLLEVVNSDSTWHEPDGEVALDMADEVLTLRRGDERRSWTESPGVTSTPLVDQFRKKLASIKIEQGIRTRQPF
jgi:hypothetical protein